MTIFLNLLLRPCKLSFLKISLNQWRLDYRNWKLHLVFASLSKSLMTWQHLIINLSQSKIIIIKSFSVNSLPFKAYGSTANQILTTSSGNGIILQFKEHFYEFTCNESTCTWNTRSEVIPSQPLSAIMKYLPPGFTCPTWASTFTFLFWILS